MKTKSVRVTLLAVTIGSLIAAQASALPPEGPYTNPANGHLYFALDHYYLKTWADAEAEAVTLGGHLVTINDQAEQAWVWSTFGLDSWHFGSRYVAVWTGLYNPSLTNGGEYVWVSGEPVTFTNWATLQGEPSYIGYEFNPNWPPYLSVPQNWVSMYASGVPGQWWDVEATMGSLGVVEVVPEPATWSLLVLGIVALLGGCRMRRRL